MKIVFSFGYLIISLLFLATINILLLRQLLKIIKEEFQLNKIKFRIERNLDTYEERYILASIYIYKNLYTQSIKQLKKDLVKKAQIPESFLPNTYNSLGFAYFKLKDYHKAIYHYKKALNLRPFYIAALGNLAYTYEKTGMQSEALNTYQLILQNNADHYLAKSKVKVLSQ